MMVTQDEIRQRVEHADQARVRARVETAAAIATVVEKRTRVRAELASLETNAAGLIAASASVMTVDELAAFTGIPVAELRINGKAAVRTRKARAPRTPRVHNPEQPPEHQVVLVDGEVPLGG